MPCAQLKTSGLVTRSGVLVGDTEEVRQHARVALDRAHRPIATLLLGKKRVESPVPLVNCARSDKGGGG